MNKAIKLGEVVILDAETNFEKGSYSIVKNIRFGGEAKNLGLIVSDAAMSDIAEDIIYAVLYTANEEQLRAYYRQDNFLYLLDSSQSFNSYFVYRQMLEDPDDELSLISAIDAHFGGHGHLHIEMTPAELRSTYGRNQNIAKFAILGVVILAFLVLVIPELTKEEPKVVQAPPPPPLVLDDNQVILLKDALSIKLAKKVFADAEAISADPFLSKHKKIKSFVVGQMDQGTGESGQYPPMIGKGEIVYEYDFPANGSENSGNDLYVQNISLDETIHVEDLTPSQKKLSQECFNAVHSITEVKNISVGSRNDNEIVYDFKDIKPSEFLRKYIFAADICPVYIRSLNGTDSAYSGTLVLYKEPAKVQ
ncbi:MAG: hypothetical protein PHV62_03320 [Sulfuricurvum sp.]|nr:hypothetical protein [Sulfuricurvum sp.]